MKQTVQAPGVDPHVGIAPSAAELSSLASRLHSRYTAFRKSRSHGSRIPVDLRRATLAAVDVGVPLRTIRRSVGVTAGQLSSWRRDEKRRVSAVDSIDDIDVRVFDVDDGAVEPCVTGAPAPLELRLGAWVVTIEAPAARSR